MKTITIIYESQSTDDHNILSRMSVYGQEARFSFIFILVGII